MESVLCAKCKEMKKKEEENTLHEEKIIANRNVVARLLDIMKKDGYAVDDEMAALDTCQLKHFKKLYCRELEAFIFAHDPDTMAMKKQSITGLKKGEIEEAEQGVIIKIYLAHKCRNMPNIIEGKLPHDLNSTNAANNEDDAIMNVKVLTLTDNNDVLPSELLGDPIWVTRMRELFDMEKWVSNIEPISNQQCNQRESRFID